MISPVAPVFAGRKANSIAAMAMTAALLAPMAGTARAEQFPNPFGKKTVALQPVTSLAVSPQQAEILSKTYGARTGQQVLVATAESLYLGYNPLADGVDLSNVLPFEKPEVAAAVADLTRVGLLQNVTRPNAQDSSRVTLTEEGVKILPGELGQKVREGVFAGKTRKWKRLVTS